MIYDLPKSVEIGGESYEIRSDYRAILDIIMGLNDPELDDQMKAAVMLNIFYLEPERISAENAQEAIQKCLWFIGCGMEEENMKKSPQLMDWEQDFFYIAAPVSRVIGQDVRGLDYLHWWSFFAAYMEIGDCTFAQVVRVRNLKAKGKRLDKTDQEFYRDNRKMVDIKKKTTEAEEDLIKQWV